ncbi:MAG: FecR domain-containing protein [Prevotella sp.]|nr:FecR domain-containing protein [Prevotella sp.]
MTDEELKNKTVETALDIMEAGNIPTEEQLRMVADDEATKEACLQIQAATTAVRRSQEHIDVEDRLQQFNSHKSTKKRLTQIGRWIAAAAVIGALVLLFLPNQERDKKIISKADNNDTYTVFSVDDPQPQITLTNSDGDAVAMPEEEVISRIITHAVSFKADSTILNIEPEERLTMNVPNGKSLLVELPDGSKAHLHPGSSLKFPVKFLGNTREVELKGEAYFVVAKDTQHPFIVFANNMQVSVLGTEFNIAAYHGDIPTVTLITGSVRVSAKTVKNEMILKPGQQATLNAQSTAFNVRTVSTEKYTNWRDGYFYYDNMPVKDILLAIGRNYNIDVVCESPALLTERMRFVATRGSDIHEILSRLNDIGKIKATIANNKIVVK